VHALLARIGLFDSMANALHFLSKTGDLTVGYRRLMQQCDVGHSAFKKKKTELNHRDIICYMILENPCPNS
jgi:hypothetical protein